MLIRKLKAGFGSVFSIFRKKPCLECRRLAAENQSLQAELVMTRAAYASRGSSAVSHPHATSRDIPATRQGLGNAPSFPSDAPTVLPPIGAKSRWAHLKASVIGFGKSELQDAHEVVVHGDNVVLIVCDGAGSKRRSKQGADFVSSFLADRFRAWFESGQVPSAKTWAELTTGLFLEATDALAYCAEDLGCERDELGCTCIVAFSNTSFSACSHVGDGRAGYLDGRGAWHSLMTPYKGLEANATVFMTMLERKNCVSLLRHKVVEGNHRAIVALSDGPESVCWHVATLDREGLKLIDPNLPSGDFFGKISNQLAQASLKQASQADLDASWAQFLTGGNPQLASEVDDKTLLIALRV
jgi:hypothetical protein